MCEFCWNIIQPKSAQEAPDVARYFLDMNHQVVKMLQQGETDT